MRTLHEHGPRSRSELVVATGLTRSTIRLLVGELVSEFIFCTGRYESGDWDSAPTLPANLIDSIARYTQIATAPAGVIVPLSSERILEYPLVYLTGHLPFRFTEAERRNVQKLVDRDRSKGRRKRQSANDDVASIAAIDFKSEGIGYGSTRIIEKDYVAAASA